MKPSDVVRAGRLLETRSRLSAQIAAAATMEPVTTTVDKFNRRPQIDPLRGKGSVTMEMPGAYVGPSSVLLPAAEFIAIRDIVTGALQRERDAIDADLTALGVDIPADPVPEEQRQPGVFGAVSQNGIRENTPMGHELAKAAGPLNLN